MKNVVMFAVFIAIVIGPGMTYLSNGEKVASLYIMTEDQNGPVPYVGIRIKNNTWFTDESGTLYIEGLMEGSYAVIAFRGGYQTVQQSVKIYSDHTEQVIIKMTKDATDTNGTILGYVWEESSMMPISGGLVSTIGHGTTDTNSYGKYCFPSVPAGTYDMAASATGYDMETASGVAVVSGEITYQNFTLPTSTYNQTAVIYGHVRNEDGDMLEDATVWIGGTSYATTTDSHGYYIFLPAPAGIYDITASHEDYEPYTEHDITVPEGSITEVDFTLYKESQPDDGGISGRIDPRWIPDAIVIAKCLNHTYSAYCSVNGSFVIGHMKPGNYTLIAWADGFFPYIKENVEVKAAYPHDYTYIEINLKESPQMNFSVIMGKVTDDNGTPLKSKLRCIENNAYAESDDFGNYVIIVPEGNISIICSADRYLTAEITIQASGIIIDHDIILYPEEEEYAIWGYVKMSTGDPVIGAAVGIMELDLTSITDDDGKYMLWPIPENDEDDLSDAYRVIASAGSMGVQIESGIRVVNRDVIVNFTFERLNISGEKSFIVGNVTLYGTGEPVAHATVSVLFSTPPSSTYTNDDGGYAIPVEEGTYTIMAYKEEFSTDIEMSVEVPHHSVVVVNLELRPGVKNATIVGNVSWRSLFSTETHPLEGALIIASGPGGTYSATSDENGIYYILNIHIPGGSETYTLTASKSGYTSRSADVMLTGGSITYQDFVLERTSTSSVLIDISSKEKAMKTVNVLLYVDDMLISSASTENDTVKLDHVKPGTYTLVVHSEGYKVVRKKIEVKAGEETRVTVHLEKIKEEGEKEESTPLVAVASGGLLGGIMIGAGASYAMMRKK